MRIPAYSAYKDSDTDFLGSVPAHWKLERLKHCAEVFPSNVDKKTVDGQVPVKLCNYTDVYYNDIIEAGLDFMSATATEDQAKRFELQQDDVVFTKDSESADDIGIAALVSKRLPGVIYGYHLSIARANGSAVGAFLRRYFESQETKSYFAISANGLTRVGLGQYAVDNAPIALPTVEEQTKIARFLDHETAKIDALIQEQERLIELLQEKRQAVISHAVTKGLDPDVPMKDSGVEWLGEVPAHWEVTRLKFVSTIIDCKNRTPEYFDDGDYLVVRTSNVRDQSLRREGAYYTDEQNYRIWTQRGVPPVGSILFTREAPAGEVCIVPEGVPLCLGQRMMNFIPDDPRHTRFIFDFLTSDCLVRYMESVAHGSTVSHLRVEQVYDIPLVIPPIEEQEAIDQKVSIIKTRFKSLIEESKITIELLVERRSALISAAVTGKIDVRAWQPPADESAFDEEVRQAGLEEAV
ncbi:type I restriction enzyme S subunit [Marinobacter sp. 3-2]|jgi:type I restriction enzyme S subunit|uniref:restriction endonuclease subunit S n=1 Tax=Marinobacter sp. 3-2 TaxID=2485141 RepID=UPI000D36E336|nr:restriction endonuclease subunit S [Marinobacter sp. 3-2]ROQ37941.1 type I restriction enzyme S subunit [Marinobacter sp. 3-2]